MTFGKNGWSNELSEMRCPDASAQKALQFKGNLIALRRLGGRENGGTDGSQIVTLVQQMFHVYPSPLRPAGGYWFSAKCLGG